MVLRATYRKRDSGHVYSSLEVVSREDYPTENIFGSDTDFPSLPDFEFKEGRRNQIAYLAVSALDARGWVNEQIVALKLHLDKWREIVTPEDEDFTI